MEPRGYDYGGGSGAGGKIRGRPTSRAAPASPYARPAPAPARAAAAAASQGGGWFSRIVAAGASRLPPSLFRKSPPQLTASATPPPPGPLEEPPSRGLLPEPRQEPLDAPPSLLPPPLEDDLPEGEENIAIANDDNPPCSVKEDMLPNSDNHHGTDLEELLKQRTFTRSEFDYLAELLWSRTIGSSSLKSEQENGSRLPNLPADFSITTYSVDDQVASPAEIAKAYMGSKSSKGSPLRLRLHDPSPMPIKPSEASMTQKVKPPTIPLLQSSRLHNSKTSDHLEINCTTPNRSAICKMSSSPYFKSGVSSTDLFSTVSSPYQTPSSVHTFGRQVLKRKSSAVNNEIVSVGPIRKMHQRYNRISPLLETRPGYRRFGGHGCKLEGSEQMAQTQKRRCLDRVGDTTLGSSDDTAHASSFGNAPVQSAEMAAKILKQLDTLVPVQKEKNHGNAMDAGSLLSRGKEVSAQSNHLGPSPSEVKDCSLPKGSNGTAKSTSAAVNEKIVAASSIKSDSQKPPTSLRTHAPANLVLSSEIDRNKMSIPSNGFTFPVTDVLSAHSQAPPTPTMAFPPILTVEKQQAVFNTSNTSMESRPRISQSVQEEGSIAHKFDNNLSADDKSMPSKNSGQGASFTCNPVFKIVNSKPTSLSNGPGDMLNSTVSDIQPSNVPINAASFQFAGSTISTTASKFIQSSSTGGSFTFSNTAMGSSTASNMLAGTASQSVAAPSFASAGTGGPSSTLGFSPLFGTASSSTAQDISKATSSEPAVIFGNQNGQSGNRNSLFTQNSANNLSFNSSEKSNNGSSQSFADSQVGSAPIGSSPSNRSSVFPWASASLAATAPPSSATNSVFGSSPASSALPMFGSKLTTSVPSSFGLPNTGPTNTLFSSPPSAVYSFTLSTPSIPNPSPTTPFGGPTVQMNGGDMAADRNGSPFPAASVFGLPSSSPSTPTFRTPATQFASDTSSSPGIFGFGQQSLASSGVFSMGPSGGNDKSGRRVLRVKKRK